MARPRKSDEDRYLARQVKFPPALWSEVIQRVPPQERSAFIRQAVREALFRRAALRLQHFYATDSETREWNEFAGDSPDE